MPSLRAILSRGLIAIPLLLLGSGPGEAARPADQTLGTFRDWHAIVFDDGGNPACMIWSQPAKAEGDYQRRGEIFVFVSHRPADDQRNRVSFETGYTYQPGSTATVTIGDRRFSLPTDGSTAWTSGPDVDRELVAHMRRGETMVVEAISSRGTRTVDTYSLLGFTAALRAIDEACPPARGS
jgi:hypothetical protein